MSKGYLKTLLKYISSVYDLGEKIKHLKDKRTNVKISTATIGFILIMGFILKIRSFNQLDDWLEHGDFKNIVPKRKRLPRIDAVRDSLKTIDIKGLEIMHESIIKKARENKLIKNGTIDGYKVVAFDGVEMFESTKKSCSNCLTRVYDNVTHYFHRSVVAAYVGQDPHIVIGHEMLKPKQDSSDKDEGESTAAKRLLKKMNAKYGHFADVLVYDAIACNAPWINTVKSYKMDAVVRVKDKRLNIVKDAKNNFRGRTADFTWDIDNTKSKKTTVHAWEAFVKMSGVKEKIRFIKFLEEVREINRGKVKFNEIWIITTATDMDLETLRKIIHARWCIENNVFRQLKTEWHMDHCFIHDENGLEATLMFMIISFNLMQLFFFRRLKDFRKRKLLQVEVIERIIKEMIVYDSGGQYIISSA